jgi:hypothetical protein
MPVWGWVLIAVAAVVLVALIVMRLTAKRRTSELQEQFGPEYDRTVDQSKNRREAESQLAARAERREQLDIRPLSAAASERYEAQWSKIQAQFVDSPQAAVAAGDSLIQDVMRDRGYPVQDFDQRAEDVSVDHPQVVENYRKGHQLSEKSSDGGGSTEDLRQAMRHYRALFDELVESDVDEPMTRERDDLDESDRAAASTNDGRARTR